MTRYRFGGCELDTDRVELRVGGQRRPVEPQVYDVLRHLVEHAERVVSKEELLDHVWGHRFVTESALTSRIKSARRAVGDDGATQSVIRTVHGKGYQLVAPVTEAADAPADVRSGGPYRPVPVPASPIIGRDGELEQVVDLMESARAVTLLGPGGVGKTRLGIEVVSSIRDRFRDGVCFVDLTNVRDGDAVPAFVATELGVNWPQGTDPEELAVELVRGLAVLIVLDNVEHVVDAVAGLVARLLAASPALHVLSTSRERLGIAGEHVVEVEPLAVENGGGSAHGAAIVLFEQVARAADPSFELDPRHNLADVVAICSAVDGLPLGVELAAGQVRALPPALLRARIDRGLAPPATAIRDRPQRHQTIRSTVDWSLALLSPAERALFVRMGTFSSPVPIEAVEAVGDIDDIDEHGQIGGFGEHGDHDVVSVLARLVDKSLVRRALDRRGLPRYTMLELVRDRAVELLHETPDRIGVQRAHLSWVVGALTRVDEGRWTVDSADWIDMINELLPEIREAYRRAVELGEHEAAARIVGCLGTFWHREGHHAEGRAWSAASLEHAAVLEPRTLARVELAAGFIEFAHADPAARAHWERALAAFRELDDARFTAYSLAMLAGTSIPFPDEYVLAMRRCDEALALARPLGERPLVAQLLNVVGELARVNGEDDIALAAYEEGRDLAIAAGDRAHLSVFLANLAYIASHRGDHAGAHTLATDALRICWSTGRQLMAAWTVGELAGPELGLGRPERAARFLGAGEGALDRLGASLHMGDRPEQARVLAELEATLEPDDLARLLEEGRALSLGAAVALALGDTAS